MLYQNNISISNQTFLLNYQLIESEFVVDGVVVDGFGVKIDKTDSNGTMIDSSLVENITANRQKAVHFLKMLAGGQVTPCTLTELVEDFIDC